MEYMYSYSTLVLSGPRKSFLSLPNLRISYAEAPENPTLKNEFAKLIQPQPTSMKIGDQAAKFVLPDQFDQHQWPSQIVCQMFDEDNTLIFSPY